MTAEPAGLAGGIEVNGRAQALEDERLGELLARLGYREAKGVAVALNDVVIPRSQWEGTSITAGDRLEIVVAVQGG